MDQLHFPKPQPHGGSLPLQCNRLLSICWTLRSYLIQKLFLIKVLDPWHRFRLEGSLAAHMITKTCTSNPMTGWWYLMQISVCPHHAVFLLEGYFHHTHSHPSHIQHFIALTSFSVKVPEKETELQGSPLNPYYKHTGSTLPRPQSEPFLSSRGAAELCSKHIVVRTRII